MLSKPMVGMLSEKLGRVVAAVAPPSKQMNVARFAKAAGRIATVLAIARSAIGIDAMARTTVANAKR